MDPAELWTRWTVRLALTLYVLALVMGSQERGPARLAWTAGCLAYLLHVGCAFQFYHHWSHGLAYEATAERTEEVVGWRWGGGLYANYIFTLVWVADAAWSWCSPESYARRGRLSAAGVHGFMGFLAFNATVVFGQGVIRWLGLAGCLVVLGRYLVWRRSRRGDKLSDRPRAGGSI